VGVCACVCPSVWGVSLGCLRVFHCGVCFGVGFVYGCVSVWECECEWSVLGVCILVCVCVGVSVWGVCVSVSEVCVYDCVTVNLCMCEGV
jgi:hypothetical protein